MGKHGRIQLPAPGLGLLVDTAHASNTAKLTLAALLPPTGAPPALLPPAAAAPAAPWPLLWLWRPLLLCTSPLSLLRCLSLYPSLLLLRLLLLLLLLLLCTFLSLSLSLSLPRLYLSKLRLRLLLLLYPLRRCLSLLLLLLLSLPLSLLRLLSLRLSLSLLRLRALLLRWDGEGERRLLYAGSSSSAACFSRLCKSSRLQRAQERSGV